MKTEKKKKKNKPSEFAVCRKSTHAKVRLSHKIAFRK